MIGKRSKPPGLFTCVSLGAVSLGALGFCGGFFGPIIFTPESNQGPLLGIFITGPLGFLFGGIFGAVVWGVRKRKQDVVPPKLKQPVNSSAPE